MLGWETCSFDQIPMTHHVKTWTKGGLLRGMARSGRIYYLIGSHPFFVLAKIIVGLARWPWIVSGVALALGYAGAAVKRLPRLGDDTVRSYVRSEQLKRLGRGALPSLPPQTGRTEARQ
jgi:hypothetical protein